MAKPRASSRQFLLIGLLAGLVAFLLGVLPFFRGLEDKTLDFRFRFRPLTQAGISPNIVFVGIGDSDMKRFGDWPWPRKLQADMLAAFTQPESKAGAVAYDVMFSSERTDEAGKLSDAAFALRLKEMGNVCLGGLVVLEKETKGTTDGTQLAWLRSQSLPQEEASEIEEFHPDHEIQMAAPLFREGSSLGVFNARTEPDGVVRHVPLLLPEGNRWIPSLALRTAMILHKVPPGGVTVESGRFIELKAPDGWMRRIPVDRDLRMRVNYRGLLDHFPNLIFEAVMDWQDQDPAKHKAAAEEGVGEVLKKAKEGVVVVGSIATGQAQDSGTLPFADRLPLVTVQINALNNILLGDFIRATPWWLTFPLTLAMAIAAAWLANRFAAFIGTASVIGLLALYIVISFVPFVLWSLWIPWVTPSLGILLSAATISILRLTGAEEKTEKMTEAFQTYFAANIVRERLKSATTSQVGGPNKPMPDILSEFTAAKVDSPIIGLGKYNLLCKLGQGGMGAVFLARQRILKSFCAIKVLSAQFSEDKDVIDRFLREARTMAGLSHPNVVSLYDCDQAEGQYFIAMEYVEGLSLMDVIREKNGLPLPLALHWLCQAARGLEYVHGRNLIHRDIKPDNMLVDSSATLKLTDLGLAKNVTDSEGGLTVTGTVMGSPHYISPEQINDSKSVDARADIYSLGISFFHMVTGQVPYQGSSIGAICVAHLQEPLPSIGKYRADLGAELDPLLAKISAKDAGERYQSATELLAALEPWLEKYPLDAVSQEAFSTLSFSDRTVAHRLEKEKIDAKEIDNDFGSMLAAKDDLQSEAPLPTAEEAAKSEAGAKATNRKNRILVSGASLLVVGGLGAWFVFSGKKDLPPPPSQTAKAPAPVPQAPPPPVIPEGVVTNAPPAVTQPVTPEIPVAPAPLTPAVSTNETATSLPEPTPPPPVAPEHAPAATPESDTTTPANVPNP